LAPAVFILITPFQKCRGFDIHGCWLRIDHWAKEIDISDKGKKKKKRKYPTLD
jgi:hypothetical protein